MSKEFSFSVMPSVSISRSRFARKSQHKMSMNLGEINVLYIDEVLPGDTRSIDMASLIRMSTPISPIMDNVYMDIFAFFCPARLTWVHFKELMGENNTGAGIPAVSYTVPYIDNSNGGNLSVECGSYLDQCGLPQGTLSCTYDRVSALPLRGLALIYNRWFRNQNIIAPLAVQTGDTNEVLVGQRATGEPFCCAAASVLKAAKLADYFTKSLPYAQKGAAVKLPLGTTAPLISKDAAGNILNGVTYQEVVSGVGQSVLKGRFTNSGGTVTENQLFADLSGATAATINDLRYAFQLQKLLEKDCMGSRYWEVLANHFGIQAPDASLQDPEYLGGKRININIDQVLSTAGYDDTVSQEVGKPGANSVTGDKGSVFTKSFTEHGYIYILGVARHDQTYCQGINRMWSRQSRFDYYWPVFANLGAQEIKRKEIYVANASSDNTNFGYQEAWAEYRYKPSIATGLLNPNATGALDYWTLANKFAAAPTLGQTFIEQDRDNIARALVTGSSGPDFICDFYFIDIAVRPMPMYSIPGLIDHH